MFELPWETLDEKLTKDINEIKNKIATDKAKIETLRKNIESFQERNNSFIEVVSSLKNDIGFTKKDLDADLISVKVEIKKIMAALKDNEICLKNIVKNSQRLSDLEKNMNIALEAIIEHKKKINSSMDIKYRKHVILSFLACIVCSLIGSAVSIFVIFNSALFY